VTLSSRWASDWRALGTEPPADEVLHALVARYAEPHRAYHTMQHLGECFGHLDAVWDLAEHPGELAIALWFHDAAYNTHAADNEEQSAELARRVVLGAGASAAVARRVCDLILSTRHLAPPPPGDAALLVDIDLAILGADEKRFDEYEMQIRREYAWVPELIFRQTRSRVLSGFLARPHVYSTPYFTERYEARARSNLARTLARLVA
jgi:predicted metal-dependent HD superfamily phosphohydrolase